MDEVCLRIEECERDGFKRGDICLLSDKNREANGWAIELTHRGYKVVSAESLLVHNEVKVKLAVSYVRRRFNPSNDSERKRFAELFFRLKETEGFTLYRSYFHEKKLEDGKAYTFFNDGQFIADFFGSAAHFFGKYETIYDLIQTFYRMMGWDELTNPYLHHFADFAHLFELAKGPDLKSFLAYYEEQKSKLAIQLPESDDAIKIMTMHKSKGLEFPVVILPSIDFSVELMSTAQFLVEVDEVILYTTLSQSSPVKELAEYKSLEQSQILTDKVNLCYVAFTRPQERLYVFNYYSNRKFGALAHGCFALFPEAVVTDERSLSLSLGRALPQHRTEEGLSSVFFEPTNCSDRLWFPDISLQDDNGLLENDLLSDERRFGNQFHLAMASINDPSEVKTTLKRLVDQGELEVAFRSGIEEKINAVFALPEFQALFDGATTILNEQAIILDEQTTLRPDKLILKPTETLVIDYKTGMKKKKDSEQVMGYVKALEAMGMPNVKGWVVYGGELVGVSGG
jgi:ATP-dependent exoDNAse (exonuclease V) beta subunit